MSSFLSELATATATLLSNTIPVYPGTGPQTKPDAYICLTPSGGLPRSLEIPVKQVTVQMMVHGPTQAAAEAAASAAADAWHGKHNWALTNFTIRIIQLLGEPFLLDFNGADCRFDCNFVVDYYVSPDLTP